MALIAYGDYSLSIAITGQSGSGAAFLTPSDALFDGRTGSGATLRWTNGTQNTSSFVQFTMTIVSTLDATAAQGAVMMCNMQGIPEGTKCVIAGVTQRLVAAGPRSELGAAVLPFTTGNTCVMTIFNDVFGTFPIVAAQEFFWGEAFAGRVVDICTFLGSPTDDLVDPTAYQRSAGGQLWQLMRKPYRTVGMQLGAFSTADAKGGSYSTIPDGGNPAGVIDIETLRGLIATSRICAVCDTPTRGQGLGSQTVTSGVRFDKDFMQLSWMVARPTSAGQLSQNRGTRWTWNPSWQEAT